MVVDQPVVVYPKGDKKAKTPTSKAMDDFYERWKAKKESDKSQAGEKISLADYLNGKI
jgi:hypothetical protein|nr:MAG TPA: hypothetical protein [Caudoviricetes sp.]